MDFAEQDVDVFDEEYDGAEAEAEGEGGASSGSSSPSSSSSSSAAASSSSSTTSSGRSNSTAGGGGDGDGGEYDSFDVVPVKPATGDEEKKEGSSEQGTVCGRAKFSNSCFHHMKDGVCPCGDYW